MRGKFQAMVQRRIEDAISVKREIAKVNQEIAELKLNRRKREKANMDIDFIHQNIDTTTKYVQEKLHNQEKQATERTKRVEEYKEKRDQAQKEKHRLNELSLYKWDFLRSFRADKEANMREMIRNRK